MCWVLLVSLACHKQQYTGDYPICRCIVLGVNVGIGLHGIYELYSIMFTFLWNGRSRAYHGYDAAFADTSPDDQSLAAAARKRERDAGQQQQKLLLKRHKKRADQYCLAIDNLLADAVLGLAEHVSRQFGLHQDHKLQHTSTLPLSMRAANLIRAALNSVVDSRCACRETVSPLAPNKRERERERERG